ncbi:hypothetical protein FisN_12Hh307 [Fistulifera solaris]|uniref:Methyltransferase domain-containing protein n=1 Tax=Fistulifera solaris TaxID=1519565 RepID=A0A1Z5KBQ5_FISSO|nr:hypothetical protein FisN_12Hh307 [Fistulifera solaris]|eukprot:GAX23730.1 hypothetical protein FisN_12Hh307 [Fistulifera solaris]
MVVLSLLSKRINRWLGPALLRNGIQWRYTLGRGVVRDSAALDSLLLLPVAQKLISLELYDMMASDAQQETSIWRYSSGFQQHNSSRTADDRIQNLETFVRSSLVPNEVWSDVLKWQYHHRILKWCRMEFLQAKYGTRFDLKKESRRNLPTTDQVLDAFGMHDWALHKTNQRFHVMDRIVREKLNGRTLQLRGGGVITAIVPDSNQSVADVSLEDLLEVSGGFVKMNGPWNTFCELHDIYQLWTQEYVNRLGDYLRQRVQSFAGETIVLDVGAGDGLLTKALEEYFAQQPRRSNHRKFRAPRIIATDDGSWKISPKAWVEGLSVEEALHFHASDCHSKQVIVLCSWMPMGEDWTKLFREKNVQEYILIGEADDGQCGDNWETWGNPFYNSQYSDDEENQIESLFEDQEENQHQPRFITNPTVDDPPFKRDGYVRKDLDNVLPYQFSRFDCKVSKTGKTVSFRRQRFC